MHIRNKLRKLINLDQKVFYFINCRLKNSFLDWIMPIITNEHYYRIPFLVLLIGLMAFGSRTVRTALLLVLIVITIADQLCNLIKRKVGRKRPGIVLPNMNQMVKAGKLSFPSNHSANNLGTAVVISMFSVKMGIWFLVGAIIIGFSRVYCGVHYPVDVLIGFVIGLLVALVVYTGYFYFFGAPIL
jgi:undecaprenyl-diphosphatase